MRPKRDPVPRAKEAWWWLGGTLTLGLLGAVVVAAGIALWENIDVRQLTPGLTVEEPPLPEPMIPPAAERADWPFEVALFRSGASEGYFEDASYYGNEIARWRDLVESLGATVRVVSNAEGLATVGESELLLLPEAPCLTSQELAAVGGHLASGGSLVSNWALGVRDGACEWRGWEMLLAVTGAEDIRELPTRDGLFLTVPAGLPTSTGLDAGTRIELKPDPSLALRMEGQRVYWSDWALNPAPDDEGIGADVAVSTTLSDEGGRVAWFGLRANQAATPADSVRLDRMLLNGLAWAAGVPTASPTAWPGAVQSALIFALDVEGADAWINARDAAAVFELEEVPISFYVVSQLVEEDEELAGTLVAAGEVGTQTVDHAPLRGLTAQEQGMRLRRSFDDLRRWTDEAPAGLRPPEETYDSLTLESWSAAGGAYLLSANEVRSASPEMHTTASGPIVVLPRLLKDDHDVIVEDVTLRSVRLADAYLTGLAKIRAIGGLATVVGHTQIISSGPRLEAFRTVARTARSEGGWWIAEARDVARWWATRSEIQMAWTPGQTPPPAGMTATEAPELAVTGPASGAIDDVWLDLILPVGADWGVPVVDGVPVDHIEESWGVRVRLGTLDVGQESIVSWARVPAQGAPAESEAAGS